MKRLSPGLRAFDADDYKYIGWFNFPLVRAMCLLLNRIIETEDTLSAPGEQDPKIIFRKWFKCLCRAKVTLVHFEIK